LEDTATNLFQPSALQGAGLVNALAAADSLVQPIASGIVSIRSIATAQQVAVSSLFTVTDPAGHPISQYEVYLADASTGGQPEGSLSQNGSAVATAQNVTLSSLNGLTYTGGSASGTDNLWMRASDGTQWSNWALVQMQDAGNSPPTLTTSVASETLQANQALTVSQLFSASDTDGDSISQYEVYLADASTGGQPEGSLSQNGSAVA